jgi:hypothetical protein
MHAQARKRWDIWAGRYGEGFVAIGEVVSALCLCRDQQWIDRPVTWDSDAMRSKRRDAPIRDPTRRDRDLADDPAKALGDV